MKKFSAVVSSLLAFPMTIHAEDTIRYAPRQPLVQGIKTLTCIGIHYENANNWTTEAQCKNIARNIRDFYRRNSRGMLTLQYTGYSVQVPYEGNKANAYDAEKFAMAKYPGADMYAIVSMYVGNYAGSGVAHLSTPLISTATHEVGHLLGLGHAGAYKLENGIMVLDPYADGQSVMGRFASANLTAPQYYSRGWLLRAEAAVYEPGKVYELKKINNFAGTGLATVIVAPSYYHGNEPVDPTRPWGTGKVRGAFVSIPPECQTNNCVALHLGGEGGSRRIRIFGNEYYDEHFTGIHLKRLSTVDGHTRVAIDFEPKPDASAQDAIID